MNRTTSNQSQRAAATLVVIAVVVATLGCSGKPGRIAQPGYASDAGAAAIAKYDQNGDGAIGGDELDRCSSIKSALARFDHNDDRLVTPDEIDARIRTWKESKVGLLQTAPTIYLNGAPLVGAEVRLVPEEFLGPNVEPAAATTDELGMALLRPEGDDSKIGVQVGLYRIEISKTDAGREIVPSRYNVDSELGVEIAIENSQVSRDWTLRLRSGP